jgi:hypothetical protein
VPTGKVTIRVLPHRAITHNGRTHEAGAIVTVSVKQAETYIAAGFAQDAAEEPDTPAALHWRTGWNPLRFIREREEREHADARAARVVTAKRPSPPAGITVVGDGA